MAGVAKKTGITDFIYCSAATVPGRGHLTEALIQNTSVWKRVQMSGDWATIGLGYSADRTKQQNGPNQKSNHHRAKHRRFNGTIPVPVSASFKTKHEDLLLSGFGTKETKSASTTIAAITSTTEITLTSETGFAVGEPIIINGTRTYIKFFGNPVVVDITLGNPVEGMIVGGTVVAETFWDPQRPFDQNDYFGIALSSSGEVYVLEHFQPAIALKEFAENQLYDADLKIAGGYWCKPVEIGLDNQDALDLLDAIPFQAAELVYGAQYCTVNVDGAVLDSVVDASFMVGREIQVLEGNASCDEFIALNNNMNLSITGKLSFFDSFGDELTRYTDDDRFTVFLDGPAIAVIAEDCFYKNPNLAGDKNGNHIEDYEVDYNGTMGKSPRVVFI